MIRREQRRNERESQSKEPDGGQRETDGLCSLTTLQSAKNIPPAKVYIIRSGNIYRRSALRNCKRKHSPPM